MIKNILIVIITITSLPVQAQKFDKLDKSPMDRVYYPENAAKRTFLKKPEKRKAAEPKIRITYSRPAKKDRKYLVTFLNSISLGGLVQMNLQKSFL